MEDKLINALRKNKSEFGLVIDLDYRNKEGYILDLTSNNKEVSSLKDCDSFQKYIDNILEEEGKEFAIGKFNEDRTIYDSSDIFSGEVRRTIHLGIDLWVDDGTPVFSPISGRVHSFANNNGEGGYGPTIILEHELEGVKFYTLYGHLSLDSLNNLYKGKKVERGGEIARVGDYPINGNWPSHLHFEIIRDMQGKEGDFPGVASRKNIDKFLGLCPNPNLILQIPYL